MRLERLFEVIEDEDELMSEEWDALVERKYALAEIASVTPPEKWSSLAEVAICFAEDAYDLTKRRKEYVLKNEPDNKKRIAYYDEHITTQKRAIKDFRRGHFGWLDILPELRKKMADHFIKKYSEKDETRKTV